MRAAWMSSTMSVVGEPLLRRGGGGAAISGEERATQASSVPLVSFVPDAGATFSGEASYISNVGGATFSSEVTGAVNGDLRRGYKVAPVSSTYPILFSPT
jgi:hypothetical protein